MPTVMKETKRALGVLVVCYCGASTFTVHSIGKLGYMARCTQCNKRYTISEESNGAKFTRPTN
jgi:hypothetical protein